MRALIIPAVHMNGTSREALVQAYADAGSVLRDALAALAETAPNGRDYYPLGPAAFTAAQNQHAARMESVRAVVAELERLAIAIDES